MGELGEGRRQAALVALEPRPVPVPDRRRGVATGGGAPVASESAAVVAGELRQQRQVVGRQGVVRSELEDLLEGGPRGAVVAAGVLPLGRQPQAAGLGSALLEPLLQQAADHGVASVPVGEAPGVRGQRADGRDAGGEGAGGSDQDRADDGDEQALAARGVAQEAEAETREGVGEQRRESLPATAPTMRVEIGVTGPSRLPPAARQQDQQHPWRHREDEHDHVHGDVEALRQHERDRDLARLLDPARDLLCLVTPALLLEPGVVAAVKAVVPLDVGAEATTDREQLERALGVTAGEHLATELADAQRRARLELQVEIRIAEALAEDSLRPLVQPLRRVAVTEALELDGDPCGIVGE